MLVTYLALRQFVGTDERNHLPKARTTLIEDVRLDSRLEYVNAIVRLGGRKGMLVAETTGCQGSNM